MAIIKSYTDLEQSKKLAEILPIESADNVIVSFGDRYGVKTVTMPKETLDVIRTPFADIRETTMCWSLAALLSVFPYYEINNNGVNIQLSVKGEALITEKEEELLDLVVNMIIHLHELKML